jgi:hypothetical protein
MQSPSITAHLQTCLLHGGKTAVCFGTLKRKKGGHCVNKAIGPLRPGMLPMCRMHQDQLKESAWCRASLACGYECGQICVWRPHGFQLCPEHYEYPKTCHLLKIPIEMRLRIYGFLLPDQHIPARYRNPRCLTSDGAQMCTALLRVNHQIHDEAVRLLYAVRTFTVELAADGLVMCMSPRKSAPRGNHALQDYQMQLVLLEQQNKRRLMMARQEQHNITGNGSSSSSYHPPINRNGTPHDSFMVPYASGPAEPAWDPPLMVNYFNMIQSFLVEIVLPLQSGPKLPGHQGSPEEVAKALELKLYDYCDDLHKLVGRFRLTQRPLAQLKIVIKLGKIEREEAISVAQVLLRPFERLRNVGKPEFPLIFINDREDREIDLLKHADCASYILGQNFYEYLNHWVSDLSSSGPSLSPPVFEAYWQLERLLSGIRSHHSDVKFGQFTKLLHTARVAREVDDILSFKAVWDLVVKIWSEYVNDQRLFRSNVALSIDTIGSIIKENS